MSKQEELKKIKEQQKALREEQKAIKEQLDAGKEERIAARKEQAAARKEVQAAKKELRELTSKTYDTFKGDAAAANQLADDIMETSTELVAAIRKFAEAGEKLEEL